MIRRRRTKPAAGLAAGLLAALLFGASAPASKRLLDHLEPLTLAASLYLGAGLAFSIVRLCRQRGPGNVQAEAPLRKADAPALAAIVVLGGIVGPVTMLLGLSLLSATAGSLLLNLEATFTILLAVLLFGEHLGKREAASAALVILGAIALGYAPGQIAARPVGTLLIALGCLAWAFDNNLTQRLSLRDPVALTHVKTLGAGSLMAAVSLVVHGLPDAWEAIGAAFVIGSLSYGLSVFLDIRALRLLGAARESVLFATAPFFGAVLSVLLLRERPAALDLLAGGMMLGGVALLFSSRHAHEHRHAGMRHEHAHVHDEHHGHHHEREVVEPHSHVHDHDPIQHAHPHASDAHHRHRHGGER